MTARRALGILIPLVSGLVVGWLTAGGNLNPLFALALEGLAGLIGGFLLCSWWAALLVPVAAVVGVALALVFRSGTLAQAAQDSYNSGVPLALVALVVLIGLLVPTVVGALIGAALGKRAISHS